MRSAVVRPRGISSINGPVSLAIFEGQGRKIYIFGDGHGSKEGGCEGKSASMNPAKTNVVGLGTETIDIDAMLHIWCLYNNKMNIPTEVLYERPATSKYIQGEKEAGWTYDVSSLFRSCDVRTAGLKYCVYAPNVHSHSADVRYGEEGTQDIFSWVQEVVVASEVSITAAKNAVKLSQLVMGNYARILVGYSHPQGLQELINFRREVVEADIGQLKKQTLEVLDAMLKYGTVTKGGVKMHKIAAEFSGLESDMTDLVIEHVTQQVGLNIAQAKERMSETGLLGTFLALADRDPQVAMDAYSQIGADIADAFLYSGAFVMDMYLLAIALGRKSEEVIIYVGARHALSYAEILFLSKKYREVKQILPNVYSDRVSRCVSDPDLIDLLQLGPKINLVRRGRPSILDSAEGRISDYNLNY